MRIHEPGPTDTARTRDNPWDVRHVSVCDGFTLYVRGYNHYDDGRPFTWSVNFWTFRDPSFTSRRYTFHDATWGPEARVVFNRIIAFAKRERGAA